MHILASTCTRMVAVTTMVLGTGCGDDNAPGQSPPVVAKAATENGDLQSGQVRTVLPNALRVLVTLDGEPASGVQVTWAAGSGTLDPSSAETDAAGFSSSTWTLGFTPGTATATASVANATGSPVTFTATVTGSGGGENVIVQVLSNAPRFTPEGTVSVVTTLP